VRLLHLRLVFLKALFLLSFAAIVFLGKFHVSQEFGVHSSRAHMFTALCLFDTIGVGLLRIVVRAGILGLHNK
jgi:hypothetical protein